MCGTSATIYGTDDLHLVGRKRRQNRRLSRSVRRARRNRRHRSRGVLPRSSSTQRARRHWRLSMRGDVTKVPRTITPAIRRSQPASLRLRGQECRDFVASGGQCRYGERRQKHRPVRAHGGADWFAPSSEPSHTGAAAPSRDVSPDANRHPLGQPEEPSANSPRKQLDRIERHSRRGARIADRFASTPRNSTATAGHLPVSTDGGVTFTTSAPPVSHVRAIQSRVQASRERRAARGRQSHGGVAILGTPPIPARRSPKICSVRSRPD